MRVILLLLFGIILMTTSCQSSRSAFQGRPFQKVAGNRLSADTTVLLLHDSQGPQATRVTMTTAQAASFSQQ